MRMIYCLMLKILSVERCKPDKKNEVIQAVAMIVKMFRNYRYKPVL